MFLGSLGALLTNNSSAVVNFFWDGGCFFFPPKTNSARPPAKMGCLEDGKIPKKNRRTRGVFGRSIHLSRNQSPGEGQNLFGDFRLGLFFRSIGNMCFFYGSFMWHHPKLNVTILSLKSLKMTINILHQVWSFPKRSFFYGPDSIKRNQKIL